MTSHIYRPEHKHPEPYQQDLNPDASKGINWGLSGPHPEKHQPRTAYDLKPIHRRWGNFSDDELRRIPLMPASSRLESNATYLRLDDPEHHPFTAEGDEEVAENDWIVPKSEVDYPLWNRLLGITDPNRTT